MTIKRRTFMAGAAAWPLATTLAHAAEAPASIAAGLRESALVYMTPIRTDGTDSRCQAEVWFVWDEVDLFVVTQSDAWRARAVTDGLTQTRVWVGDLGQWQRTDGRYRDLPELAATGSVVDDTETREQVLARFGEKYAGEWLVWGPRFHRGLADGSRVLLRYRPLVV